MPAKKTFSLDDESLNTLENLPRSKDKTNWSQAIQQIINNYLILVEASTPQLSKHEWNAMYQCYNGYAGSNEIKTDLMPHLGRMVGNISDCMQSDGNFNDWIAKAGISQDDFLMKAHKWTMAERLAVFVKCINYWQKPATNQTAGE